MDSSLQRANPATDDRESTVVTDYEEDALAAEEEHHIHLPNPSLWPALLSVAILVSIVGLLFIPDAPWLTLVGAVFILVGILGWALEDPMAAPEETYISSPQLGGALAKFQIGQTVIDRDGESLGTVQARMGNYILADRGGFSMKVYYVPLRFIENDIINNTVRLKVSEVDLLKRSLDRVPADLYDESPEYGVPAIKGVPMFARGPLSPAETGHYNYGPNFPGINTDAAGSYHPDEVRPTPQRYVSDRRGYNTRRSLPPRVAAAD
ncbi:PRC-barrel domain-containing protein [Dictyobacter aurantiacus]|uniref:Cytochrome c oxidase polypeptide IV n=1 Tax=Dictyobacter aurantiacus TaxID=1936993 RepID=A0A401Z7V0_9CHLR|nr:PRC-barrel domain-containing protein [Dictyobacter aurantiacus]GCE02940.1 hypothetical protein KDAU_02690 [Dictyobacter aurantiacus]